MSRTELERLAIIETVLTNIDAKVDEQGTRLANVESTLTSWKGGGLALTGLIGLIATLGGIAAYLSGLFSR